MGKYGQSTMNCWEFLFLPLPQHFYSKKTGLFASSIDLYLLPTETASLFTMKVRDFSESPLANELIMNKYGVL
jgi:hypothetical protein